MVQINFASREVNCKIVFYGPGRCGKTTNLQLVHEKAPANSTGELVSIATETDRTLYFDFLPLDLGTVAGMRTKFQLYTVPGQVYYDATRKLVLQGCDGIVFVADSNPDLMAENIESLDNLGKNLKENGLDLMDIPLVLQFNKRDLPNAMPIAEMNSKLNRNSWPAVEAVAVNGDGVFQTLKAISQGVIKRLNREQGYTDEGKRGARPSAMGAAARLPVSNEPHRTGLTAQANLPGGAKVPSPLPKPVTMAAKVAPPPPKSNTPLQPQAKVSAPKTSTPVPPPQRVSPTPKTNTPIAAAPAVATAGARTNANPFRDRLNEIRKQSGSDQSTSDSVAASSEVALDMDGAPVRKGCLGRMIKGGAVAGVLAAVGYCLVKFTVVGAYLHIAL